MVPSFAEHYTMPVKNAVGRTDTLFYVPGQPGGLRCVGVRVHGGRVVVASCTGLRRTLALGWCL